jgi:predicted acylesterase/phospholipase RssA
VIRAEIGDKSVPFLHPSRTIYLALSGGGFRATAYHLGVILAYVAYNQHHALRIVNGVSGGSIAAAHFGKWWDAWRDAKHSLSGITALRDFACPLIKLIQLGVRWKIAVAWATARWRERPFPLDYALARKLGDNLSPRFDQAPSPLERVLDTHLFHGQQLWRIIPSTLFVLTTTDLFTGSPFYITSSGSGYRPHRIFDQKGGSRTARVARAASASAAVPFLIRPIEWRLEGDEADEYRSLAARVAEENFIANKPLYPRLVDGGVSDNIGITFFLQWVYGYGPTFGVREQPSIKFLMAYDAGRQPASVNRPLEGRVSTLRGTIRFWDRRKESLNNFAVSLAAREVGARHMLFRYEPALQDQPPFSPDILRSLMRIRTDFNQFSDTEIYALAYCGYRTAVFGMTEVGLVAQAETGNAESLRREFNEITEGLLSPLPDDRWARHLNASDSAVWLNRKIRRVSPL